MGMLCGAAIKCHDRCVFPASIFHRHLASHQTEPLNPNSVFFIDCFLSSHERAEPQHFRFVLTSFPFVLFRSTSELSLDPFADAAAADPLATEEPGRQSYIHIRIQQRNGRKTLTTLQGLPKGESYLQT